MLLTDLKNRYLRHAATYYSTCPATVAGIRAALECVPSGINVKAVMPRDLKRWRDRLVRRDLARSTVNAYINRILAMFRWGVEDGFVDVAVYSALMAVRPLQFGRSRARETERVQAVSREDIEHTIQHLPANAAVLVRLQLLTAARSGELLALKPCDVDTSGAVWTAQLVAHKEAWRGLPRVLYFGPQAQALLRPYLVAGQADRPMFGYSTTTSYGTAVRRACVRAGVVPWHPHQLRHTAATEIRADGGLEAAQVALGHARADVTQIYAERDDRLAKSVAERR